MIAIEKARASDLSAIAEIYEAIHTEEEAGRTVVGWQRSVYPTLDTARAALERDDLYALRENGIVRGAAVINRLQVDCYALGSWTIPARDDQVLVLHTLVISPEAAGRHLGRAFVGYYENTARALGCRALRMDTNALNAVARAFYKKLGYREAGIVPTTFNGIPGVQLVLLEKRP